MKLLLIDDEPYILDMLKAIIDWDGLNISLSAACTDGEDALTKIELLRPDIVVTDIRIPGTDGLELIRSCREKNLKCRFIVISGYKQFEYAQRAMSDGVREFLLKPINKKDINDAIQKVINQVLEDSKKEQEKNELKEKADQLEYVTDYIKKELVQSIIDNSSASELSYDHSRVPFIIEKEGLFLALLFRVDILKRQEQNNKSIYDFFLEKHIASMSELLLPYCFEFIHTERDNICSWLIAFEPQYTNLIHEKINDCFENSREDASRFRNIRITIAIGESVDSAKDINRAIGSVRRVDRQRIVRKDSHIIQHIPVSSNKKQYVDEHMRKSLYDAMEHLDRDQVVLFITNAFSSIQKDFPEDAEPLWDLTDQIASSVFFLLEQYGYLNAPVDTLKKDLINKLSLAPDVRTFQNVCIEYISSLINEISQTADLSGPSYIRLVKKYISEHYRDNLSLGILSEHVHLNPAYLSASFRKNTSMSISEYINEVRINHAKELLCETADTVYEIGNQVGYQDQHYFSKVFKQFVGVSPLEYRNSKKIGM